MRVPRGVVAQLGERRVRNAKVGSSILLHSTRFCSAVESIQVHLSPLAPDGISVPIWCPKRGGQVSSGFASHVHRNRHGVSYFRPVVPLELRHYFGSPEMYRSLKAASLPKAKLRVRLVQVRVDVAFSFLRRTMPKKIHKDLRLELITMVGFNEFDRRRVSVTKGPSDTAASSKVAFEIPILGTNLRLPSVRFPDADRVADARLMSIAS